MKGILKFTVLLICLILATNLYNLHLQNENNKINHNETDRELSNENKAKIERVYYENGKLKEIWMYDEKLENGMFKKYYRNGHISSEGQVLNGEYHGIITYYYDDGNKEAEWEFVNGIAHGEYKVFHKNGNLKLDATRNNGTYHGTMTHYNENGKIETRTVWSYGQVIKQTNFDFVSGK